MFLLNEYMWDLLSAKVFFNVKIIKNKQKSFKKILAQETIM